MSDEEIVDEMETQGLKVARRTVTKYRQNLLDSIEPPASTILSRVSQPKRRLAPGRLLVRARPVAAPRPRRSNS